jgi:predicted nucleic acid-binding protein
LALCCRGAATDRGLDVRGARCFVRALEVRNRGEVAIDGGDKRPAEAAPASLVHPGRLDYLISTRVSPKAATALLDQVAAGAYRLEPMGPEDVARASDIIGRYRDLELGLADASVVVLAERHGTHDLLTLDERHFRAVAGPGGRPFRVLPADR